MGSISRLKFSIKKFHELESILDDKLSDEERRSYHTTWEMLVRNDLKDKGKFEKALLELKDLSS